MTERDEIIQRINRLASVKLLIEVRKMAKDINELNTAITNLENAVKNAPPPAPPQDFTEQVTRIDAVTAQIPAPTAPVAPPPA